jgi:carbon monoxide dehydrogenase subunit G
VARLRCERTVAIARPPGEIFPWLLDAEKVPRWVSGLEVYRPLDEGPLRVGTRIHQELVVSGHRLTFEMELTHFEPPHTAEQRFSGSGFRAANQYRVAADGAGSQVTWAIGGETTSFSARLMAPMVESRLQEKLGVDLDRLRTLLEGEPEAA